MCNGRWIVLQSKVPNQKYFLGTASLKIEKYSLFFYFFAQKMFLNPLVISMILNFKFSIIFINLMIMPCQFVHTTKTLALVNQFQFWNCFEYDWKFSSCIHTWNRKKPEFLFKNSLNSCSIALYHNGAEIIWNHYIWIVIAVSFKDIF